MQLKDAEFLRFKWGDRPCEHKELEKEYYLSMHTGEYVCSQCGKSFDKREKIKLNIKQMEQNQLGTSIIVFGHDLNASDIDFVKITKGVDRALTFENIQVKLKSGNYVNPTEDRFNNADVERFEEFVKNNNIKTYRL